MITLEPVGRALVPRSSEAAVRISGPNYDEFQGDREIRELIQSNPSSILRVTMAHCDTSSEDAFLEEGSEEALQRSASNMTELIESPDTRVVEWMLWVYEIARPGVEPRQIGLGGLARTGEIRTNETPHGVIIRNEGVREPKARGRADLIERTRAYVGIVNNTVEDRDDILLGALREHAQSRSSDFAVVDEEGWAHGVWLVTDKEEIDSFRELLAGEPCAFVADGNHRSAAAAMVGRGSFLSVFFPAKTMGISPYNRLVETPRRFEEIRPELEMAFEVEALRGTVGPQARETHEVGLYTEGQWYRLQPRAGTYDPANAVEVLDADIVQRKLFDEIFGITDAADERLRYVGSNKDAAYLVREIDAGRSRYVVTLPAVTMPQFIDVCRQNRFMPPKSTWFEPKVRSGLVIALFD
ncbi:MAG: DUF1015 domain-containing protein [bacterium]|nr:DUF1015 domain-containing protein [bacterium]